MKKVISLLLALVLTLSIIPMRAAAIGRALDKNYNPIVTVKNRTARLESVNGETSLNVTISGTSNIGISWVPIEEYHAQIVTQQGITCALPFMCFEGFELSNIGKVIIDDDTGTTYQLTFQICSSNGDLALELPLNITVNDEIIVVDPDLTSSPEPTGGPSLTPSAVPSPSSSPTLKPLSVPTHLPSSTSGSCGQNATWDFDRSTGTITISGTGDMNDYSEALTYWGFGGPITGRPAPWIDFAPEIKQIIISPGITSIGHYAFQKCNISSVFIPDSVTSIGAYAFQKCEKLERAEIETGAELLYAGLFYRCTSLKEVSIPSSVTTMYGSTFGNCTSLSSVSLPDGLETITSGMFEGCSSLTDVSMGAVSSIEKDAFNGCEQLRNVYYNGARGQWNKVDIHSGNTPVKNATVHFNGQSSSNPYDFFVKTSTYTSGQFTDVSEKYWGAANIKAAYEYGLMVGTSGSHFSPQSNLSIAQTIVLACRLHNIYYYEDEGTFEGPGAWYQPYVDYAKTEGIVTKEYTNYSKAITRWEFAKIMSASLPSEALPAINTIEDNAIPDVKMRYLDPSATLSELIAYSEFHPKTTEDNELLFGSSVYQLYRAGILSGNDKKGTYKPYSSITRAEAAAIITRMAVPSLRVHLSLKAPAFTPVPLNKLANLNSLRSGATNAQLQQAYNKAVEMLRPYANLNKEDQMFWAVMAVGRYRNKYIRYSMSAPHYDDPYGFFVLNTASCAGDTRALGLCLNILGISYEHVNPGAYTHQWARVKLNGKYWVCDADVFCCQAESKPYTHPYLT